METTERRRRAMLLLFIVGGYLVVFICTLAVGPNPGLGSAFTWRFYALIVEMGLFAHVITVFSGMFRWIRSDLVKNGKPGWLAIPICFPIPLIGVFAYVVFRAKGLMLEAEKHRTSGGQIDE